MRFFDRKHEIKQLQDIRQNSELNAQFTIITGRRRIGKTSMVLKAYEGTTFLYFFVSRKAEAELCNDFQEEMKEKLGLFSVGKANKFSELFNIVMQISKEKPITLFIDEFQDFSRVNKSIFSDMQRIWDLNKTDAKINLIVCGSVNSMMNTIFKNEKEPLFGRQTGELYVKPFAPSTLKEILSEYKPNYSKDDLLALYAFTGGVAKYVEYMVDNKALGKDQMLDLICKRDSLFINEGKSTLIEEFGKDYGVYFSILSAIAAGYTRRSEIEDLVAKEIGGYLTKLEDEYGIIKKKQPLFERVKTSNARYQLFDSFFIFWFRFIFKYNYMVEIEAFDKLRTIIERDYDMFSGLALERYFTEMLIESKQYTRIGGWWDRKGENEIDIIAENELENRATFFEVKRQKRRIETNTLDTKQDTFLATTKRFKGYAICCKGLSLEDM